MYAKTSKAMIKTSVIIGVRLDFLEPFDGFVKNNKAQECGNDEQKKRGHALIS
jgi:hypothetical protein